MMLTLHTVLEIDSWYAALPAGEHVRHAFEAVEAYNEGEARLNFLEPAAVEIGDGAGSKSVRRDRVHLKVCKSEPAILKPCQNFALRGKMDEVAGAPGAQHAEHIRAIDGRLNEMRGRETRCVVRVQRRPEYAAEAPPL
jgi:hypothetical protein